MSGTAGGVHAASPISRPGGLPPIIYGGFAVIVVLVLAIGYLVIVDDPSSGSGGDGTETAANSPEGAVAEDDDAEATGTDDEGTGDDGPGEGDQQDTGGPSGDSGQNSTVGDLPAPDIPASADPPEMYDELEDIEWPIDFSSGEAWPAIGELPVDVSPGEHVDTPVFLEEGQMAVVFAANDGVYSTVELFDPDGESVAVAEDLGEEGTVEGLEFFDDPLEQSGVYVFRTIQDSGHDEGYYLRFFAPE